jgi:hypothetical protein
VPAWLSEWDVSGYRQRIFAMIRKGMVGIAIAFSLQMASADDFQKSYPIAAGGQVWITNFNGDIRVTGFEGESIEIVASKKGPDSHLIKIEDRSVFNWVNLSAKYLARGHGEAKVDYDVRVPESRRYNFFIKSFFSGNLEISSVIGRLRAESGRGSIKLSDVRGKIWGSSVSGNIDVNIGGVPERSEMRFDSISGNIIVRAPSNFDAWIDMSSPSGSLRSDFPIEIRDFRYGPGQAAHGKVGSGHQVLYIRSNTGNVSLVRKRGE